MADINQVITLGIGSPSDIAHFVLVGLSPAAATGGTGAADVTILVRPEATVIHVQPEATTIQVRQDPTDIEVH